ncbi:MAG: amino acid ABC transporter substrate-binding protein [Anaerolineaceae bacterium]|nr:amino acid ABC transporter substrate-binding protein [Anaerolineaceae bacterium]
MKKKVFLSLVIFALLAVSLVACKPEPANRLEAVQQAEKIVVGTSADYEPWEYKDEDDNFVGIDMLIMQEVATRMGVEVEFQDLGFDTLVAAVETGKIDAVIAAMASTEERQEKVDFSIVYYAGDNVMVTTGDSGISFSDPLEAANYKVGTQSGTIMYYWLEDNLITPGLMDKENVMLYERNEQLVLDLEAGRVDIAIMDLEPGKQFMADENFDIVELWRGPMDPNGQAIAIMKGEAELKAEIDKHLTDMLAEGFIKGLLDEYDVE